MIRNLKTVVLALALAAASVFAAETVLAGGMEMHPQKDVIDNCEATVMLSGIPN